MIYNTDNESSKHFGQENQYSYLINDPFKQNLTVLRRVKYTKQIHMSEIRINLTIFSHNASYYINNFDPQTGYKKRSYNLKKRSLNSNSSS